MKIEVNFKKKHFVLIASIIALLSSIAYVIGQNPSIFEHKANEIDWSEQLTQMKITNLNVTRLCIGADCKTSWPSGGGATLPSCGNQQVLKYSTNTWVCANDIDTDTRCDTSGKCAQLCIGTDCKNSWASAAVTSINNRNGAINIAGSGGVSVSTSGNTITISAPILTQCTYNGRTYTVGTRCSLSCVNRGDGIMNEKHQLCGSQGWGNEQTDSYYRYCQYQLC